MKNKKNEKGRRPNKAMVAQEEEDDEDHDDSVDEDDEDDYDNDAYITTTYNTVCAHACVHDEIKPTLSHVNVASLVRDPIIIDSGARGANVTGDQEGLTDTWKDPTERVQGLTGAPVSTVGNLPFAGKTLVIKTDVNLLAMHNLLPDADAHFKGDRTHIEFFRGDGVSLLRGTRGKNGFWTCSYDDLVEAERRMSLPSTESYTNMSSGPNRHFTHDERVRARQAYDLCAVLGHPGRERLARALENGNFAASHLTPRDVLNAEIIHGRCPVWKRRSLHRTLLRLERDPYRSMLVNSCTSTSFPSRIRAQSRPNRWPGTLASCFLSAASPG
jgi:hypothetical protein